MVLLNAFLATTSKFRNNKKEKFGGGGYSTFIVIQVFFFIISLLPFYLSWKCGLKSGLTVQKNILKLLMNAFCAFCYGIFYLISYYLKIGCCHA